MNADQTKRDVIQQLQENMTVAHFAVSDAGVYPLLSGPLPDVKLYMPEHFSQLGYRRIVSPARPSDSIIAYVGFAVSDPAAAPISFGFNLFFVVATHSAMKIAWVLRDSSFDQVIAAVREICRRPPFPVNAEQETEVVDFVLSLHAALSPPHL